MTRFWIVVVALGIGLVPLVGALAIRPGSDDGSVASTPDGRYRGSEPPPDIRLPAFRLASYRGPVVSTRSLRGKVAVVTFLDTKCTDKCPILANQVAAGLRRIPSDQRRRVAAFAISVNPKIDTPRSIQRFLARRHALAELDFLRGSIAEMRPVWKAFHILSAYETGNADVHSADVRIFDRRGEWVSTLHAGVDLNAENLSEDILAALES
jgi:protein SCO1